MYAIKKEHFWWEEQGTQSKREELSMTVIYTDFTLVDSTNIQLYCAQTPQT